MEKKTWKITLASGTVITGLEKNGNCFISSTPLPDMEDGLLEVVASADDEQDIVWHNAELVSCAAVDDRYWFTFREPTEAELATLQMQAKVDYIAMMTNVDLEEV
jgi:hypothetical protein